MCLQGRFQPAFEYGFRLRPNYTYSAKQNVYLFIRIMSASTSLSLSHTPCPPQKSDMSRIFERQKLTSKARDMLECAFV
jgi:hypothetical protein